MRITQWGEYGVLFCAYLARRAAAGEDTVGAAEIARELGIQSQYVQQIMFRLKRGGIVDSVRGPQGGYSLLRSPSQITLLDVLVATEGETFELICDSKPLDAERCSASSPCALRPLWRELRGQIDNFLSSYTVASVAQASDDFDRPIQLPTPKARLHDPV